jgi:hypothetical protein
MSKNKKPPQAQPDDRDGLLTGLMNWGRGRSALPPTPEPTAEPTYVPPSRQTKKTFTAWMDRDALALLKRLSEHKRVSQQKLIAEAFNLLFEKHGLPPIAT